MGRDGRDGVDGLSLTAPGGLQLGRQGVPIFAEVQGLEGLVTLIEATGRRLEASDFRWARRFRDWRGDAKSAVWAPL